MSTWSGRLLAALAWVGVVAVGAVLVWVVISRAGAGLVADSGPLVAPPAAPTPTSGGAGAPPTPDRRATWQGEVGVVTATCRDGAIALVGAQPEEGSAVRVVERGPLRLVVEFAGEDEGPVTVIGTCRAGRPQFAVSLTGTPSGPHSPVTGPDAPGGTGGERQGEGTEAGPGDD